MNAVDIGILVIVGLFAVGGLRRGFMLGVVDLVAFGLAIVVAAQSGIWIAGPLVERGFPADLAAGAGFVIAIVVSLAIIGLVVRILLAPLAGFGAGTPLGWVNSVLGLVPGAVRGLAIAALLVLFVTAFPPELNLREPLDESRLAAPIARTGREALDSGLAWAGIDPRALGIP